MRNSFRSAIVAALALIGLAASAAAGTASATVAKPFPNIVFILADDLGYGDVGCYNPEAKAPTPNLDRLAKEGLLFSDAHSPSTVCTPSRYSILTGRMAFRTGMKSVFSGVGGPCLIEPERLTLPGMLRAKGYTTALFGKWHVGMTFFDKNGAAIRNGEIEGVKRIDYSRAIPDAPIHRGFDRFFGTVCCPTTDWLYAFVDGDRVPVPPTGLIDKAALGLPTHVCLAAYALQEKSPAAPGQLYDLEQDPGETNNLYFNHPEVVNRLKTKLDQAKKSGRSVPQPNKVPQAE